MGRGGHLGISPTVLLGRVEASLMKEGRWDEIPEWRSGSELCLYAFNWQLDNGLDLQHINGA